MLNPITDLDGTYIRCLVDKKTRNLLDEFVKLNKIPNPVSDYHCSIVHCLNSTHLRETQSHINVMAEFDKFEIWELEDKGYGIKHALVMLLKCPELEKRYRELKSQGITCKYNEFKPHITLSMDIWSGFLMAKTFAHEIRFIREDIKKCKGKFTL